MPSTTKILFGSANILPDPMILQQKSTWLCVHLHFFRLRVSPDCLMVSINFFRSTMWITQPPECTAISSTNDFATLDKGRNISVIARPKQAPLFLFQMEHDKIQMVPCHKQKQLTICQILELRVANSLVYNLWQISFCFWTHSGRCFGYLVRDTRRQQWIIHVAIIDSQTNTVTSILPSPSRYKP